MRTARSRKLLRRARGVLPGGVSSPVRAFGSVGGIARFIARASGCRVEDVDGNSYVDYVASWGAILLGHAHPHVVDAVRAAAGRGTSYGAPTEAEIQLGERLAELVPSVEMVRLVCSGTEATMSAIRLARAVTGRDRILKFDGCYHGHADMLLAAAGSGVATLGIPGSVGVPADAVKHTCVVPYNDLGAVEEAFAAGSSAESDEIAAVIVEPIAANMGLVLPTDGFLEGLREICNSYGTLLVFDEVITGFRVGSDGAQGWSGVSPDLSCFGKIIGGGLPVGAYAGPARLMERVAPEGDVYQAGTLAGNPLVTAAGLAVLERIGDDDFYSGLHTVSEQLASGLVEIASEAGVPFTASALGGLFGFFFHPGPVRSYADARDADEKQFKAFFAAMLEQGVYLAPSPFEAAFVTAAHGAEEVAITLEAARKAFKKVT